MPKKKEQSKQSQVERVMDILLNDNSITVEDKEELLQWLACDDKAGEKAEAFIARFSSAFGYDENPEYMPEMWPEIVRRLGLERHNNPNDSHTTAKPRTTGTPLRIPLRRRAAFRVAAVLLPFLIVAAALGLLLDRTDNRDGQQVADVAIVSVPVRETTTLTLPDGSTVTLYPGSELEYPEAFGDTRQAQLTGKAFFRIARDESKPFTLTADGLTIDVLGTEFMVVANEDSDYSSVTLHSGSVSVSAGRASVILEPGEQFTYNRQTGVVVTEIVDVQKPAAHELKFNNRSRTEIFAALEQQYGITFVVPAGVDITQGRFSVDFDGLSLYEALQVLSFADEKMEYRRDNNNIHIQTK